MYSRYLEDEIDPAFSKRAELIFDYLAYKKASDVLDCGCGRGFYPYVIQSCNLASRVIGIDFKLEHLAKAKEISAGKVSVSSAALPNLPFLDESFDIVICSEVLEHVKDDKASVAELFRILKKGGTLLVTVPNKNFPFMWDPLNFLLKPFGVHLPSNIHWLSGIWADHERLYSEQSLREVLETRFRVETIKGVIQHSWPFSHFLLYGLGKNLIKLFNLKSVNRFSRDSDKRIAKFLSKFMKFPSKLDRDGSMRTVNLFGIAHK